jgi:hypothetical protein
MPYLECDLMLLAGGHQDGPRRHIHVGDEGRLAPAIRPLDPKRRGWEKDKLNVDSSIT